jgi:hypothetical protein
MSNLLARCRWVVELLCSQWRDWNWAQNCSWCDDRDRDSNSLPGNEPAGFCSLFTDFPVANLLCNGRIQLYDVWSSHGCNSEEYCLLACEAVSSGINLLTLLLVSCSFLAYNIFGLEDGSSIFLRNFYRIALLHIPANSNLHCPNVFCCFILEQLNLFKVGHGL